MTFRTAFSLLLAIGLMGCETPYKKADKKEKIAETDQSGDTNFRAFVGRLRIAVANKDLPVLVSMMAGDFGYRFDTPPEGESVFAYWDQNNLWGELSAILRERFVPKDDYMVSPQQFVADPSYSGYRVGLRMINGSWRFVYFVGGEHVPAPAPAPAPVQ